MKIAMIIEAWKPIWGGGQEHALQISKQLSKNNKIDLFVMNLDGGNNIEIINDNLNIIRYGKKTKWSFLSRIIWIIKFTFFLNKKIKKEKYDIIHGHSHLPGIVLYIIKILNPKLKTIYTIHVASYFNKTKLSSIEKLEKFIHTKINYDSLILVGSFLKQYKFNSKNISVIGNGFNNETNNSKNLQLDKEKINILTVGRLSEQKGIDIAIKTMNYLDNKYVLNIVGSGEKGEYIDLIKKNGLENRINIIDGTKQNINNYYKSSDLFILLSRYEGFGIVLLEAISNNLLVISTKSGGVEDIIKNGENGFLTKDFNPKNIAEKIDYVNNLDKKTKEQIKKDALKQLEIFTRENISKQIENLYIKLIK